MASCRDCPCDSASCRESQQEAKSHGQSLQEAIYQAQQSVPHAVLTGCCSIKKVMENFVMCLCVFEKSACDGTYHMVTPAEK